MNGPTQRTMTTAQAIDHGLELHRAGRAAEAERMYREVLAVEPNNGEALHLLGVLALQARQYPLAVDLIGRALHVSPDAAVYHNNIGEAYREQGDAVRAEQHYRRAIALKPDYVEAHYNLGIALRMQEQFGPAEAKYRDAIAIDPNFYQAYGNLGTVLQETGRVDEAIACYRDLVRVRPQATEGFSNLLLALNYAGGDPAAVFAEHADWGRLYGRPRPPAAAYPNPPDPARRLRVGYVSADLREHSVAYFLEPVLRCHDRAAVEPVCYSDTPRADAFTAHLRNLCPLWRDSGPMSHDRLAEQVRADGIDILVDLGGHTAWNRLPAFALAPAPVQATYLGYPNTTGLPAVGYRITDATADPPGDAAAEAGHAERLVRLPRCFLSYRPPAAAPAVADPPCLGNGYVTFGSFNALAKVTAGVLGLWASVLHAVPGSRLVLKAAGLADPGVRGRVLSGLADHGVGADRLTLAGREAAATAHLAWYGRVDVGLDPTPYAGTTTTCEALWMGVPVVTLAGDRHAGRVGASVLAAAGLGELVADTPERYVAIAKGLAADPGRLAAMRRGMRDRLRSSALMDHAGFTRHLEAAYRRMWHEWCAAAATGAAETPAPRDAGV